MPEGLADVDLSVLVQLDQMWGRVWISDQEEGSPPTWLLICQGSLYCQVDEDGQPIRFHEYEAMVELLQQAITVLAGAIAVPDSSE